jgi:hypothetical protein
MRRRLINSRPEDGLMWAAGLEPPQALTGTVLGKIAKTNVGDEAGFNADRRMPAEI